MQLRRMQKEQRQSAAQWQPFSKTIESLQPSAPSLRCKTKLLKRRLDQCLCPSHLNFSLVRFFAVCISSQAAKQSCIKTPSSKNKRTMRTTILVVGCGKPEVGGELVALCDKHLNVRSIRSIQSMRKVLHSTKDSSVPAVARIHRPTIRQRIFF